LKYLFLLLIFISTIYTGSSLTAQNKGFEVIQKDKHFLIVGNDESRIYRYTVYDSSGKVVESGEVGRMAPDITYISSNIIEIRFHGGTYADLCRYYNITTNIISTDAFWNPFLIVGEKIVHYDGKNLIVQNIFDKNVFFKEFPIDMIPTGPPEYIKFIDNGQKLKMKYMRESDNKFETRIFDLS